MSQEPDASSSSDAYSIIRFYENESEELFKVFSLWTVDETMSDRNRIYVFPKGQSSMEGAEDHIFPSVSTLPDLNQPYFHMATLHPNEGTLILYSLIFKTANELVMRVNDDSEECTTVPANSLITLVIESKFLHPNIFHILLTQIYNRLSGSGTSVSAMEEDLEEYWKPKLEREGEKIAFPWSPFDITMDTEIGKLQHYMFTMLKPLQICKLLVWMLIGDHVFMTAMSTTNLCMGCFGALALIYPIPWSMTFISTIPERSIGSVQAPGSLLAGIPWVFLSKPELRDEMYTLVNLDFGSVDEADRIEDPKYDAVLKLTKELLEAEVKTKNQTGVFPAYRVRMTLWRFMMAMVLITYDYENEDWKKLTHRDVTDRIQEYRKMKRRNNPDDSSWKQKMRESQLIDYFAQIYKQAKIPPDWNDVFSGMDIFQNALRRALK